jgi:hypothetical protein
MAKPPEDAHRIAEGTFGTRGHLRAPGRLALNRRMA